MEKVRLKTYGKYGVIWMNIMHEQKSDIKVCRYCRKPLVITGDFMDCEYHCVNCKSSYGSKHNAKILFLRYTDKLKKEQEKLRNEFLLAIESDVNNKV